MKDILLKGYHGTCSFEKESIRNRGLDPNATRYRNDHWLGQGVYFFEDVLIAQWWAVMLSNKRHGSSPLVYEASITAKENQILNLDNNDEQTRFRKFVLDNIDAINALCKEKNNGFPVFDPKQFRAVFFDYYKEKFGIKVIIFTFSKSFANYIPNIPVKASDKRFQEKLSETLNIGFKEKQICVSDEGCITNYKVFYDGEEAEVI